MRRRISVYYVLLLTVLLAGLLLLPSGCAARKPVVQDQVKTPDKPAVQNQIRTPHFLDSFPKHKETLASAPKLVKINFNFDLGGQSSIEVFKGKTNVASKTTVAADNLSMEAPLKSGGPGTYLVKYTAYWPDGSNHQGQFVFYVKKDAISKYVDLTGKPEVTVDMKDLRLRPADIIISKGTKVTWINKEDVTHFVNSDPHASHNVVPRLNSRGLGKNAEYSFVFDEPGEWGYHCSAHYKQGMIGHVVVR